MQRSHRDGPELALYRAAKKNGDGAGRPFFVSGADEVGRGAFAGPLTLALVIFPESLFESELPSELERIDDSKALSASVRAELVEPIKEHACFWSIVHISNRRIDRDGLTKATRDGLQACYTRAVRGGLTPAVLLMDGKQKFGLEHSLPELDVQTFVGGDADVLSIAAASILAKESRDQRMVRMAALFPGFGFDSNKGYGTQPHRERIAQAGPCALHRKLFLRSMGADQLDLPF